jgi:hypothetical protein
MNEKVEAVLKQMWESDLALLFAAGGQPAHWRQEPYRSDFFAAFAKVYRVDPAVDGERVKAFLGDQRPYKSDPRYDEKMDELAEICDAWTEWAFAWKKWPES